MDKFRQLLGNYVIVDKEKIIMFSSPSGFGGSITPDKENVGKFVVRFGFSGASEFFATGVEEEKVMEILMKIVKIIGELDEITDLIKPKAVI